MNKILILSLSLLFSCSSADKSQAELTAEKMFKYIELNENENFQKLILNQSVTMPKDNDFERLNRLFDKSEINKGKREIIKVEDVNKYGQTVFKVPYFRDIDSTEAITKIDLILYFGPREYFPKNKLSGFETKLEYDTELRKKIYDKRYNIKFD